jgi:hypothetical protein
MKKYTVILLRPDYLADDDSGGFGQDVYMAFVEANTTRGAVGRGQRQVFRADTTNGLEPNSPDDYALIVVFPGHITPELWGWEL